MSKSINILDKDYVQWIKDLSSRYRRSQIKAAVKVNQEVLKFYWELGRDIVERNAENKYGSQFYTSLSRDLKEMLGIASGFSVTTLKYSKYFFCLYSPLISEYGTEEVVIHPQVVDESKNHPQPVDRIQKTPQLGEQMLQDLFAVPWGHHRFIIDKCKENPQKALFFVHQTVVNGWSRNMLLNFLDTDLYERQGKALTNFKQTLPDETSELMGLLIHGKIRHHTRASKTRRAA